MGKMNEVMKNEISFKSAFRKIDSIFAMVAIPIELAASILIYIYVMGDPSHFIDNNVANNPIDYLGTVYKGGFIVPVLMTMFLMVITFFIERSWTLYKARGKRSPIDFVCRVKEHVCSLNIDEARKECDLQGGSVANVLMAGLNKYAELERIPTIVLEKKVIALQKELQDVETLEVPMLEKNLVILSTIASIATLLGLFGTVLGMIRSFKALAYAGAPDAVGLATGISEALINTALGIGTSMLAIIFYNYFASKIDSIMYYAAETGQVIVQTFSFNHKD
jgi:biopolymer transport protein ExbB